MSSFLVTLDRVPYLTKPENSEIGRITNRLKAATPTELDPVSFCECVRRGLTWVGATYEPSGEGWGRFLGQQIFALDFDNDAQYLSRYDPSGKTKRKRPLYDDEVGFLPEAEALARCEELGLVPMCSYRTLHDGERGGKLWNRYRIVFDMGEPVTDEAAAEEIIAALLRAFPEADKKCSNSNRLFFGSNGTVCGPWFGEVPS